MLQMPTATAASVVDARGHVNDAVTQPSDVAVAGVCDCRDRHAGERGDGGERG
jgi:hypothetical protein